MLKNSNMGGLGIAERWGLPGNMGSSSLLDPLWKFFSYDTLVFSTLANTSGVEDIKWQGLDNTIYYMTSSDDNPVSLDFASREYSPDNNKLVAIDSLYKIKFSESGLDLRNMVAVKILIEKAVSPKAGSNDSSYNIKIFVSGEAPNRFADSFNDNRMKLLNLNDSGFEIQGIDDMIVYDPVKDKSRFADHVYTAYAYGNEQKRKYESYSLFFFLIPHKSSKSLWTFVGSIVHFWPLRERTTLVAKLDKNNHVIDGPYFLPYEYLVCPNDFIKDNYLAIQSGDTTTSPVYNFINMPDRKSKLNSLFYIDANAGDKLLFLQGVTGGASDDCPQIYGSQIYKNDSLFQVLVMPDDNSYSNIKKISIDDIPDPNPVENLAALLLSSTQNQTAKTEESTRLYAPVNSTIPQENNIIRKFMSDLTTNAYIINFENVNYDNCAGQNIELRFKQNYSLSGSSYIKFTLTGKHVPDAPASLLAKALSANHVRLTWIHNSTDNKGYNIYRATGSGDFVQITRIDQPGVTRYDDETVKEGTFYRYQVIAFNLAGPSHSSNTAEVTTPKTIPLAPGDLVASQSDNAAINLSWLDNSFNEEEFVITRTEMESMLITQYIVTIGECSTTGNRQNYRDTDVIAGVGYMYSVKARNSAGESEAAETNITFQSLVQENLASLVSTIAFQNDIYGIADHWIPNSGQLSKPFGVNLAGKDIVQAAMTLLDGSAIKILPPLDPNWEMNAADNSNINRNKGTCDYGLYATDQSGTTGLLLATFELNAQAQDINHSFNNIIYNAAYFDAETGKAREKDGCFLRNNGSGALYFQMDEATYAYFALKIMNDTGTIRPGDDVVLQFALADHPEKQTNLTLAEAGTSLNFLAVVDKILLDRANLYIDERLDSGTGTVIPGAVDWNGSQQDTVPIAPATWHNRDFNEDTNRAVYGAVIYSISTQDAPLEFNEKLRQQVEAAKASGEYQMEFPSSPFTGEDLQQMLALVTDQQEKDLVQSSYQFNSEAGMYYLKEGLSREVRTQISRILIRIGYMSKPFYNTWYEDDIPAGYPVTLAPLQKWDYYWRQGHDMNFTFPVPMGGFYPYCPALSSHPGEDEYWSFTKTSTTSAGVDCVGLVQRCASYRQAASDPDGGYAFDNPYTLPDIGPVNWSDTGGPRRYIVTAQDRDLNGTNGPYYLWTVSARALRLPDGSYPDLNKVIPGKSAKRLQTLSNR